MPYTKVFPSLITSTMWTYDSDICKLWVTMLALKDQDGIVEGSIPGLAHVAHISLEKAEEAFELFQAPDPHSRTPDNDGRRIERVPGGWRLLNNDVYNEKDSLDEKREKARKRQRRKRARDKLKMSRVTSQDVAFVDVDLDVDVDVDQEGGVGGGDEIKTPADEVRELERRRRSKPRAKAKPTEHDRAPPCPQCGRSLMWMNGKHGPFYKHPRGSALGCDFSCSVAEYRAHAEHENKRRAMAKPIELGDPDG